MKKRDLTEVICRRHCQYYKEGKEDLLCGTYRYLMEECRADLLRTVPGSLTPDFSEDTFILDEICSRCDFYADGCEFRQGGSALPCGGYAVVEWLRRGERGQPSH